MAATGEGVGVFDIATGKKVAFLPLGITWAAVFEPDGGGLLTSSAEGLHRWPIEPHPDSAVADLRIGPPRTLWREKPLERARLSSDGGTLGVVRGSRGYALHLSSDKASRGAVLGGQAGLASIAVSPDGRWIATGAWHGSGVGIWDAQSGRVIQRLLPEAANANAAFSPDGRWLVTGTGSEYGFWEVGSWLLRHRIPRERAGELPGKMAFTRDGRLLAVALSRRTIRLVDPGSGRELATLQPRDRANINSLCFSPDGGQLGAATANKVIELWDLRRIRQQLAAMGLDWDRPPLPPAERVQAPQALRVEVVTEHEATAATESASK